MRLDRHRGQKLKVETNARLERAGTGAGKKTVVEAASTAETVARPGEAKRRNEEKIDLGGRDDRALVRVRFEKVPTPGE